VQRESERMRVAHAAFAASPAGREWAAKRAALPVSQVRTALLAALSTGDCSVLSGDTGCGKTTQVPQYILEHEIEAGRGGACEVVCTQPRRLAAMSVAERVAEERAEPAPGRPGSRIGSALGHLPPPTPCCLAPDLLSKAQMQRLVLAAAFGSRRAQRMQPPRCRYHVRLDPAVSHDTRLTFCTTGILLRRLASDPTLASVSHVIVDEVHERSLQGDFLFALLKRLVSARHTSGHPLKIVLMSATIDLDMLSTYLGGAPTLTAQGRTFPVEQFFLEDAYKQTGYRLEADAPAALRPGGGGGFQRKAEKQAGALESSLQQPYAVHGLHLGLPAAASKLKH
jgi:ATP-dependent RNA helicase DHX29